MKLNPNNLRGSGRARLYNEARHMQEVIEKGYNAVIRYDDTRLDSDSRPGRVRVNGVLEWETRKDPERLLADTSQVVSAELTSKDLYEADVVLEGWSGEWGVPIGLDAKVSRLESEDKVVYKRDFLSDVGGPNTRKVIVDKATGTMDVRDYMLGFIRVPALFPWHGFQIIEESARNHSGS